MKHINTFTCLALLPLAGLVTVAAAQQEAARTDGGSTTVLRAEREFTISLRARSPNTAYCEAQIDLEYLQYATIARVEGMLTNEDCAASSGDYDIDIRSRDESGSLETVRFRESWQRDDDQPVMFSTDYQIGENVDLISVRTRNVDCACADTPEGFATLARAGAANAQDSAGAVSASPAVEQAEDAVEGMSRRELRRRVKAARAAIASPIDEQELECRTQKVTGSRMPGTTCATPEQWAAFDAREERELEEMMRRSRDRTIEPAAYQGAGP